MAIKSVRELFQDNGKSNKTTTRGFTSVRDLYATEENLKPFYESFQSALTNWSTANTEYYKSVEDYYKNLDQSSYGLESASKWKNDVSTRNQWLLDEADRLNKVLDDYGRYFDSATIADIRKMFGDTRKGLNSILTQADTDIDYWSQFKDEGDYHNYYFGNKYAGKTYNEVYEAYKATEGKESDWLYNNLDNFKSSAELQTEIDALNKDYDLDAPYLEQALKHSFGDVYDWLDSGVDEGTREWARNEKARLTELKAKATKKEEDQQFLTAFLPSELFPEIETPDFAEYVEKGKSKGKEKGDWDGPFVRGYESDIIAIKEGKLTASGDGFYQKFANAMDDDQYNKYAYLFGKHGKEVADKYLRYIEPEIDAKEGKRMKELADAPVLDNLFHAFANWERLAGDIASIGSDEYKAPSAVQIADQMLGAEKKGLEKVLWDVDGNIAYMLPSMLAGRVTASLLGPGGYGVMSAKNAGAIGQAGLTALSSYGAGRQEMLNLGYSESQANMYGLLSGASEAGLQYLIGGMGKYTGLATDEMVKGFASGLNSAAAKFAIDFGADIIGEFGEEWAQEVLTPFFKKIATGRHENVNWEQAFYAGALGALSAGVMNGADAGATRVSNLSTARDIKKSGKVDALKNIGNTFSADTLAYKLASKVDNKTSTWKLATLINEMNGTLSEQNKADIKYQLMREGMMESDAETISKWLGKAVDGENFTALQRKALDNNPIIQRVFKKVIVDQNSTVNQRLNALMELEGKDGHAGMNIGGIYRVNKENDIDPSKTSELLADLYSNEYKRRNDARDSIQGSIDTYTEKELNNLKSKISAEHKVSKSGTTTNTTTGMQINIKRVTETDGKTATYALADGSTISNKNVEYADNDEGLLYEGAISLGYDANITNAIIHGIEGVDLPVIKYLNGVDEAIEYGRIGYPMDKISTNGFYADLPDSMKTYAYNLGKESAKKDTAKAQERVDANKGKVEKAREGEVVHLYEKSGLTSRQEASLTTLGKVVSDITHNKVYIFDTIEKTINGKKVRVFANDTAGFKAGTPADNGFINKAKGEIYIDLHAGMSGEGVILWTLAHELTHFVRQWSPTKFNVLADFLMAEYGKQGVDVKTLIDNKVANSRNKLTRDQAYEEVVADAMQTMFTDTDLASKLEKLKNKDKGLWNKIKQFFADLYKRIKGEYKDVDAQTDEAKKVREMSKKTIERISDLFAEGIVDAGNTYANLDIKAVASGEVDIDGNRSTHAMSIRSMVEGVGLSFEYDEKTGQMRVLDMYEGTEVTSVTKEQVKDSPLGNIVSLAKQNGFISDAEASKQYGFLAELVNLCLNYKENFTMVWEIAGTQVFSAIKANSDTQYGKTIDFSTVCKKTQQVINVISETQKRLKRGLTKDEIKNIVYYETGKAGEPTPCPVCYVFSRWMGIGGILQQMSDFQKKYEGATEEDMRNFINDVESEIIKHANTPNKSGKLKGEFFDKNGKPKFGTVIADLKAKANSKIRSADIRLKIQETETLLEKADIKDKAKLQKTLNRLNSKLAKEGDILDAKLKEAEALLSRYEEYQWLTKTYMDEVKAEDGTHLGWQRDENFKPVDEDVLWDLREGARFATEFPKSWLYRTTKGCNAGKAILPYSDARVGETIQGVAYSNVKDITIGENNAFLNGDTKAQADYVTRAIKKQLAQNLIGGMRYQSTSDFRYEYGSDYLITFLEMQAIGAKVQLYTKVIEAVDFLCTMGAEVNLSVMPLNDGYIELADGRKQLVFSSVTGINAEAAIAKTKQYDNAQLILVGISDEHIRLALEGDDVNGDVVTFVIPFHGSGNTVKAIQELMDLLGEDLDVTKAQDYSLVQTDHFAKNRTAEQIALWDLRKKIISRSYKKNGNTVSWDGVLTSAEEALLNSENGRKYLKDLYNRFYVDKNADEYGVSLSTAQAEQIFPYEYWDKSLTYAEADQNGERFKDYCATMGIVPRFSGVDSSGKALGYGDFTNNKGYWKLLIDRKMYNNDGTYHAPQKINVTNFKAETLNPAWGSATYGDVMQKDTNPKKTNAITENVIRQIEAKDNFMFSFRNSKSGMANDALTPYNEEQTRFIKQRGDYIIDSFEKLKEIVNLAFDEPDIKAIAHFGMVDVATLQKIKNSIPNLPKSMDALFTDNRGYSIATTLDGIRHIVKEKKLTRQDVIDYLDRLADTIVEYDEVDFHYYTRRGRKTPGLLFRKDFTDGKYISYELVSQEKQSLLLQSIYLDGVDYNKKRKSADPVLMHHNAPASTSKTRGGQTSTNMVAQNPDSVNTSDKFSFSERKNIGYHAGDLGKAEFLHQQGRSRGTGHFGTGTYFVGNEEAIGEKSGYGNRPHHAVDFSDYNLYKIKNDEDGYKLHRQLKLLDGGITEEWLNAAIADEFRLMSTTEPYKIAEEKYGEDGAYTTEAMIYGYIEFAKRHNLEVLSREEYAKENGFDSSDEDLADYYHDYLNETTKNEANRINEEYREFADVFFDLKIRFGFKKVETAMRTLLDYQKSIGEDRFNFQKKNDSFATVFMKALGYEGIDVRGTKLDNTEYGSVIYDIKDDSVLFSERNSNATDNRTLLVNALESVAQNDVERSWLSRYKSQIEKLNDAQNKLAELRAEIHKIRFSKGQDRKKLPALETQADILAERINRADKKLLNLEASKPLQKVIDRERAKAYKLGMEKLANYRKERAESKALNYYRPRIEKIVSDLSNRLEHPSAKTAIPEAFGASVAKVLSAFNFTTYDKDGNIRPTKANVKRAEAKRDLETLAELLEQNTIEATYGQLDIPPEMLEWIKSVATYFDAAENLASNEFDVNKMNEEQLKGAYKFLRSLQTAINNAGKYYTNAHYDVASDANSTMEYVGELPAEASEKLEKASKILGWDLASPVTAFDRFGEGGKHVYNMLVNGQSKMAFNVQEILDFVEKAYTEKEAKEWRETLVPVTIGGEEYNVTVDMLMGLHCLLKQEDSKVHILEGAGIRFADVKHKGKVKRFKDIFFHEADAIAVEKALDAFPRAREVADAMQKFMEETGSAWGNEVSMIRFGYRAFTIKGYYPIRTIAAGDNYTAQQKRANIYALLNKSFTKERTEGANNAVIVDGIFSVFNNHMAEMALYNAWAMPVIDTIKWFNYKESQDVLAERSEKSVQDSLRLAYGDYAKKYIRDLLEAINNQMDSGLSEEWGLLNMRLVNRVAVAWNLRVVVQQPFSVARAYELINPKYVTPLIGEAYSKANEEMLANSGIAKWKSMGYYDVDVSRPLETQVMKNAKAADKFTEVGLKGAELADSATWTALWNACKKETAEKNKGITEAELLKKTAERFDDIILRTQVVDSVLTKTPWSRSKKFWHKATSAFMSEPLTSYNALLRQYDKYSRDLAIHGAKYANANNYKSIAKAVGIFILSGVLNAIATAPLDAMRDDDDYETYWEKFLESLKDNVHGNIMIPNLIPYVKDVATLVHYGRLDNKDMTLVKSMLDAVNDIKNLFDPDKYSVKRLHDTFNSVLKAGSQVSGFAVSNIWRDAVAIYNTVIASNLGYGELKFQVSEDKHSEGYKRMYDAIASGDEDRADYLFGQLLSNGVDEDKVYNGLTKCVKEAFQDGNITEEEATKLLKDIIGFVGKTDSEGNAPTDDDIYWMIDRWKYTEKEGYSRYDDLYEAMENGDPTSALEWHVEKKTEAYLEEARREAEKDGKTFSETKAKREAKAKAESSVKSAISSYWKPKYKEAYKKGDTEEMKRIRYILRDTKLYGSVSDILDTCKGWLKD